MENTDLVNVVKITADKVNAIRMKAEALAGQSLGENADLLAEIAVDRACAYCCRSDIPAEMEQAVAELMCAMGEDSGVKAVTRGDTSVTYSADAARRAMEGLAPWRRLGRLKEDV